MQHEKRESFDCLGLEKASVVQISTILCIKTLREVDKNYRGLSDLLAIKLQLTFPEFHFETETKVDFPSACI